MERVHPAGESPYPPLPPPLPEKQPQPMPGTYVIQVPKDQIYRVPTPADAYRFKKYTRRTSAHRRRSCCCCLLSSLAALLLSLALAAAVIYLIFRPKIPKYTVETISMSGFNLTTTYFSPEFDVAVKAENPNKKIGIYYRKGSSAVISRSGVALCSGGWPEFYQGARNVTVFTAKLTGSGIKLSEAMRREMAAEESKGAVPLEVRMEVPVRVKFGAVTTWTVTVKVHCDVTVDKLTASSRVVSNACGRAKVDIF